MTEDKPHTEFFEELWKKDVWTFELSDYEQARFAHELKMLEGRRYRRALELGCGAGAFTRMYAPLCDHVVATDIAQAAVERGAALNLPNVEFRAANAMDHETWVKEGPWDLIVFNDTICYLGWRYTFFEVAWFARQMKDALAQGGKLLMANTINDEGGDYLLLPFVTLSYRDLFKNVGFKLEKEDRFAGQRNGVTFTVVESLFSL
jgi:predicted TPR repeat methyltransferase